MELLFLALLVILMAAALGSGFPVAFALPGSAIITIALAALSGWMFAGSPDAFFAQDGPSQWLSAGVTNLRGVYWEVERDTLIAIPLFVFMGIMLQRSKIAEDLLVAMAQLFGPVPGGLGISVIFVGALLAATTGILGATVVAMGLISLPAMMRNNYSNSLSSGTIAASGTLGQIIPPSIVLIILADQLASATDQASTGRKALYKEATGDISMPSAFDVSSTSAGEMFLGALVPGLILVGLYMTFVLVLAILKPKTAPAVKYDGKMDVRFFGRVSMILIPPLTLIFVVLGSIIAGIATVNQAGAIGAVGATIMAGYRLFEDKPRTYVPLIIALVGLVTIMFVAQTNPVNIKNMKTSEDVMWATVAGIAVAVFLTGFLWSLYRTLITDKTLHGVMIETAKTTSLVFIILLGAAMLTAAFRAFGGEELVKEFLTSLPGGFWVQFAIVMLVIFLLGFFLDFIEIAVVVVPIVAPILLMDPGANVTAVWLGVMIGLNIQTSFLTPPFGFALFYLRGVAPAAVKTIQMYKGVIPFICLQLIALAIVASSPWLVNWLPSRVSLLSDNSPPPVNPRLQYCIDEYTIGEFAENGADIRAGIATASGLDFSYLPKKLQKSIDKSFSNAEKAPDLLDDVVTRTQATDAASPDYKPLHVEVRSIQKRIRKLRAHKDEILKRLDRSSRSGEIAESRVITLKAEVEELEAQAVELEKSIPAEWEDRRDDFSKILKAEQKSRTTFRTAANDSYKPVRELVDTINATAGFEGTRSKLEGLKVIISNESPEKAVEAISALRAEMNEFAGARTVTSELSKVRKALKSKKPDADKAQKSLDKAIAAFESDLKWRNRARAELAEPLNAYEEQIRGTLGLRSLPKLPEQQAKYVASCQANHRNLSLYF